MMHTNVAMIKTAIRNVAFFPVTINMNLATLRFLRSNTPLANPDLRYYSDGTVKICGIPVEVRDDMPNDVFHLVPSVVSSTGDDRTVNNVARHEYRALSDEEEAMVGEIKDRAADFITLLQGTPEFQQGDRDMQLAIDHIEDASMPAVRAITK